MESAVKRTLSTKKLTPFGGNGGGCINEGRSFVIDDGSKVYVKYKGGDKVAVKRMFLGELASLEAIADTRQIRVPRPTVVDDYPAGSFLVMEHLEMRSLTRSVSARLGTQLANLHLHNQKLARESSRDSFVGGAASDRGVNKFGFDSTTCCGFLPLNNDWSDDWVRFYCEQRLEPQMNMDKVKGDREAHELWGQLLREIPKFFQDLEIRPALLHGDLWSGNVSQTCTIDPEGGAGVVVPVIFDPATFYGHDEFEFGIVTMFGGFDPQFFDAYHSVIPERPGHCKRLQLYQLFHHLNHWNHFGSGYRGSSLSIMRKLLA